MAKIQWTDLPPVLLDHLFDRARERQITTEDLYELMLWRESEPEAPDGLWYKDFGSFKICGDGSIHRNALLEAVESDLLKMRGAVRQMLPAPEVC